MWDKMPVTVATEEYLAHVVSMLELTQWTLVHVSTSSESSISKQSTKCSQFWSYYTVSCTCLRFDWQLH